MNSTVEPRSCGFCGAGGGGWGVGAIKFEPLTVIVKEAPPGVAVVGVTLLISGLAGTTGSMINVAEFWLSPPPGAGFEAVICAIPGVATSEAKTARAIWFVFTFTTPDRGEPFQYAVVVPDDPEINPCPEMFRTKVWLPAVMLAGARFVMMGVAFGWVLVPEEPHPDTSAATKASIPNVVHRRCINRFLR